MMHVLNPIEVDGLSKSFGRVDVLTGLTVGFPSGKTTAVIGPNGAGKTTLLKCVLGLVHPDQGEITVGGEKVKGSHLYRRNLGYMPQHARYPDNLTGRDMIELFKSLRSDAGHPDLTLVRTLHLEGELDKPFRTLSGGTRQKISALLAFMFSPPIYILDEPTAGLDPVASTALKDHIRAVRDQGASVVLTSHVVADLEELADRIVFLLDGRIRYEGPLDGLRHETGERTIERAIASILEGEAA
jgi:Cu-processing system ATP-binding protein